MARIVFYEPQSIFANIFQRYRMPRLGPIILGTILEKAGHDVSIFSDAFQLSRMEDLLEADLVGISTITASVPRAYEMADHLRSKSVPVIIGGPHVTFMAEEALQHADFVFRGEADNSILQLTNAILSNDGLEKVPGLSYKKNGKFIHNEDALSPHNLDELPYLDFDLIHREHKVKSRHIPAAIMTSRGCPYNCSFCSVTTMFGKKYRFQSSGRVIDELSSMDLRGRRLFFCDDHLAADRSRLYELLESILIRALNFTWSAQVRTDIAQDEKLLALMKRAGCRTLFLGFESINPETLISYKKHQTVLEIEQCIKTIRNAGIRVYGMFVLGADTDTIKTVKSTLRFALDNKIETYQTLILTPLPGTDLYEQLTRQDRLLHKDWSQYDSHHIAFKLANMEAVDLYEAIASGLKEFYSIKRILFDIFNQRFSEAGSKMRNRRAHLAAANSWRTKKERYKREN